MSSRQNIRKRIAEIKQHKGHFEGKKDKLNKERPQLIKDQVKFDTKKEEFDKLYQEYWPKNSFLYKF